MCVCVSLSQPPTPPAEGLSLQKSKIYSVQGLGVKGSGSGVRV